MRSFTLCAALASLLSPLCSSVAQTDVTCHIKPFNTVGTTLANQGSATSINRYGNVVGTDAKGRGFLRLTDGRVQVIPIPVPRTNPSVDIVFMGKRNASGTTVGWTQFVNPNTGFVDATGFVNRSGTTTLVQPPLIGINRYGTMLAASTSGNAITLLRGTSKQTIHIPVAFQRDVELAAISDTGVVVGSYALANSAPDPDQAMHGFVEAKGKFQDLAYPDPAENMFVKDINASGMIVGQLDGPSRVNSFIYKNGTFFSPTFVFPNGTRTKSGVFINGVNGFGSIVGSFSVAGKSGPFVGSCSF